MQTVAKCLITEAYIWPNLVAKSINFNETATITDIADSQCKPTEMIQEQSCCPRLFSPDSALMQCNDSSKGPTFIFLVAVVCGRFS